MSKRLEVKPHQTLDEVREAFDKAKDGKEKLRWQIVVLKKQGWRTDDVAEVVGCKPDWVRRMVRRYNAEGLDAVKDKRSRNGRQRLLDDDLMAELRHALDNEAPPGGGLWTGRKVNRWILDRIGVKVNDTTGYAYLARLGYSLKSPRPRATQASSEAQERFKKGGSKPRSIKSLDNTPALSSRRGRKTKPASD